MKHLNVNIRTLFHYTLYKSDDLLSNVILRLPNKQIFSLVISHWKQATSIDTSILKE